MKTCVTIGGLGPTVGILDLKTTNAARRHLAGVSFGINCWLYIPVCIATLLLLTPPACRFFADQGWRWLHVLSIAFGVSLGLTPQAARVARRLNILDVPDARKLHGQATPLLGGAAIFVGLVTALLVNGILTEEVAAILSAAMILFVTGVFDDWRELSAGLKLAVQITCTSIVMSAGVTLHVFPEVWGAWSQAGNLLLTVAWIVGITNALNFFDGMDGLAAGLGAIIAFMLGLMAFQTRQPFIGWFSLAVLGSCLGFLPFNLKRKSSAVIFLGDAGSTVIGFVLACIAVYGDWSETQPLVSLASPILIFWTLIFDMVHITVDRIVTGKVYSVRTWLEYVGKDHLHHRLADALGGRARSVGFIYMMTFGLGLSALLLRKAGTLEAVLVLGQGSILVLLVTFLERSGRRRTPGDRLDRPRAVNDELDIT
jgi:UDP-GlcNAc:undecaprenyl-phosphate GlcNAc-1-phosphate transferase